LSRAKVGVIELIAWGLDEHPYRNSAMSLRQEELRSRIESAQRRLVERGYYISCPALLAKETERVRHLLTLSAHRDDLQEEYKMLDWTLGVVDLRRLLAFQRRLIFSVTRDSPPVPPQDDWPQLISLAMGPRRGTRHRLVCNESATGCLDISLHASNPDLQLRLSPHAGQGEDSLLSFYGGSPFFEVAEFRGRWFLRDGYHRAYRLLQAGVYYVPAVVIRARSLEELGATQPWFFNEEHLFSDRPPGVADFLDENLVLEYERAALRKVIRIRIDETLEPFEETDEIQGDKL
jgi:hypothetical protein